jgi:dipeptidyl aminopeptidase/acylaminoacyl peptidase
MVMRAALPLVLALGLVLVADSGGAIPIEGPQLAYNFQKVRLPRKLDSLADFGRLKIRSDLVTAGPLGELEQKLLKTIFFRGRYLVGGPSWSPDGSLLALTLETSTDTGEETDVYVINRDGTELRRLTRFGDASEPVVSIDGKALVFLRAQGESESEIWSVGIDGTGARPITSSLPGNNVPTSVSPSGDIALSRRVCRLGLGFSVVDRCRSSVWFLSPVTGIVAQLAKRATAPAFSPDGRRIAYVSQEDEIIHFVKEDREPIGDLFVLDLATGQRLRLTSTKRAAEAAPSWDPSGQRLVFVRDRGRSSRLVEINADGSCEVALPQGPRRPRVLIAYDSPTWQPGIGRGADPIAC